MRTPVEVAAAAATRYRRAWRDALLTGRSDPFSFPLNPPTASIVMNNPADVDEWLTAWRAFQQTHPSATLRPRTVRTRHGDQPVPTHLDLPDLAALADLNVETRTHWRHATQRWNRLDPAAANPATLRPWLTQLNDLAEADLTLLLDAAAWFRANPNSGLTIRRVPVPGMHTKWLARHRRLVLAVLGHTTNPANEVDDASVLDVDAPDLPDSDLDALGLRPLPREADIVLADPRDRGRVGGLRHLRAPVDELAQLPVTPSAVLVIENKEAALAVTDATGLVVVHSLGNHLDALSHLPWIASARTLYWGDLDRHGFTLLSRARSAVPHLRSVLMTAGDIERFRDLAVTENVARYDAPDETLTSAERHALRQLVGADGHVRIEQERIPEQVAHQAIEAALADA